MYIFVASNDIHLLPGFQSMQPCNTFILTPPEICLFTLKNSTPNRNLIFSKHVSAIKQMSNFKSFIANAKYYKYLLKPIASF